MVRKGVFLLLLLTTTWSPLSYSAQWSTQDSSNIPTSDSTYTAHNGGEGFDEEICKNNKQNRWLLSDFPLHVAADESLSHSARYVIKQAIFHWNIEWSNYQRQFHFEYKEERVPREILVFCESEWCQRGNKFRRWKEMVFLKEGKTSKKNWLGQTDLYHSILSRFFYSSLITIDDRRQWFYDTEGFYPEHKRNGYDYFGTAIHELGHLLGLVHSSHPHSVMRPGTDYGLINKRKIHRTDFDQFVCLYLGAFNGQDH